MKQIKIVFLMAFSAIFVFSCKKMEEPQPTPSPTPTGEYVTMTLTAAMAETKTFINEDGTALLWHKGDEIAIFDNISNKPNRFVIVSEITDEGAGEVTFQGLVPGGATKYLAAYPYSAAESCDMENERIVTTIPEEQTVGSHRVEQGAFVAVGKVNSEKTSIDFFNVFGRIKIVLGTDYISEVIVRGTNLSGKAEFNCSDGSVSSVIEGNGSVRLRPNGKVFGTEEANRVYMAVLPGTTAAGSFSVKYVKASSSEGVPSHYGIIRANNQTVIEQTGGLVLNKSDINITGDHWKAVGHITDATTLWAWNGNYSSWTAEDIVYLDNDIDMNPAQVSGMTLTDAPVWEAHDFPGTFDGQDHAIKNFTISSSSDNACFFGDVTGTVKNLTFGSDGGSDSFSRTTSVAGKAYVAPILSLSGKGRLDNITNYASISSTNASGRYLAGICGIVNGGEIKNCTNHGSITANFNATSLVLVGGITASSPGHATISHCTNNGNVTILGKYSANLIVGGIAGYRSDDISYDPLELISCRNTGKITNSAYRESMGSSNSRCAGIIGRNHRSLTVSACVNEGEIVNEACATGFQHNQIAGIIAWNEVSDKANHVVRIDGCVNRADLTNNAPGQYVYLSGILAGNEGGVNADKDKGIAASYNTTYISNTANYGNITNTGDASSQVRMGGFIGDGANSFDISNCYNYGNLSNNSATDGTANMYIGGFMGSFTKAGTKKFTACHNRNCMSCRNTSSTALSDARVGGVVGYASQSGLDMKDCTSSVDIKNPEGSITAFYGRVFVGYLNSVTSSVDNCGAAGVIPVLNQSEFTRTPLTASNYGGYLYGNKTPATRNNHYYMGSGSESYGNGGELNF